jgi:hypothetical protein
MTEEKRSAVIDVRIESRADVMSFTKNVADVNLKADLIKFTDEGLEVRITGLKSSVEAFLMKHYDEPNAEGVQWCMENLPRVNTVDELTRQIELVRVQLNEAKFALTKKNPSEAQWYVEHSQDDLVSISGSLGEMVKEKS